jgi:hypothetical protein
MVGCYRSFSEFERSIIRDRVLAGMARANAKGTRSGKAIGRPSVAPVIRNAVRQAYAVGGSGCVPLVSSSMFPLKPCAVVSPFNRSRPGRIKTTRSRPGTIFYFLRLGDATAKSSSQLPSLIAATSQREVAPPPAQVFPCLSRYLIGTVRPLSADPRPILIGRTPIPKRASWF